MIAKWADIEARDRTRIRECEELALRHGILRCPFSTPDIVRAVMDDWLRRVRQGELLLPPV